MRYSTYSLISQRTTGLRAAALSLAFLISCGSSGTNSGGNHHGADGGSGAPGSGGSGASAGSGGANGVGDADASAGDGTAVASYNKPCSSIGNGACLGHAQTRQLVCDGTKWVANGSCVSGTFCDTTPGARAGSCQPIVPECKGASPGDIVCQEANRVTCGPDLVTTTPVNTCTNQVCVSGSCTGACARPSTQCSGNGVQTCDASGQWGTAAPCINQACVSGACIGVCTPTAAQCSGNGVQTCDATGHWSAAVPCMSQACASGACSGTCAPASTQCSGNGVQVCDATGHWGTVTQCSNQTCFSGACTGVCAPAATRCSGNGVQKCDASGQWGTTTVCTAATPTCSNGACTVRPSCSGLASTCGPNGNASCCSSSLVPGGTYDRSNDSNYPATVSDFVLDTYEVTVGRFRKFVAAYSPSMIAAGAGKNANNPSDAGWDTAWNASLPATATALTNTAKCGAPFETWTDSPAANENRPMDCVWWFTAYAFCVWDGGRLPTEAEWNYAAAGGNEQRMYPWSSPPSSATIDDTYAVYCGGSCSSTQDVGSKSPKGDGKWGQADLAGNVYEWTVDWVARPYAQLPCINCSGPAAGSERTNRGPSFNNPAADMVTSYRNSSFPTDHNGIGVRCARAP